MARAIPMEIETDADLRVVSAHSHPLDMRACVRACKGKERQLLLTVLAVVVVIIVGSVAGTALNVHSPSAPPSVLSPAVLPNSLTFVAIGDWGRHGSSEQNATAGALGLFAASVNARFVVNVGDSFYTDGLSSRDDPQWRTSFTDVYTHPTLQSLTWYSILGNHDYRDNLTAQVGWSGDSRWYMPDFNYTATWPIDARNPAAGCVAAVFIDTVPLIQHYYEDPDPPHMAENLKASNPAGQLIWIDQALAAARATCGAVIVVGHHPLQSEAQHGNYTDLVKSVGPLLEKYKVDAYLAGHDHTLMHMYAMGFDTIITGAGSEIRTSTPGPWGLVWYNDINGFTVHSINATHMLHSFVGVNNVTVDGAIMHATLRSLRSPVFHA